MYLYTIRCILIYAYIYIYIYTLSVGDRNLANQATGCAHAEERPVFKSSRLKLVPDPGALNPCMRTLPGETNG